MKCFRTILLFFTLYLIACSDNINVPQNESLAISGIDKSATFRGDIITVYGSGFGSKSKVNKIIFKAGAKYQKDSSSVRTDSVLRISSLDCIEWNNSKIKVKVPFYATTGKIIVFKGIEKSNSFVITINKTPDFISVPILSGKFTMGSKTGFTYELPEHEVTITYPFLISSTEVSQELWMSVINNNPSLQTGNKLPVHNIKWIDAVKFCNELSKILGYDSCYNFISMDSVVFDFSKNGFRLPTEAEWEYSCRAGTVGNYSGTGNLDDMGWYDSNSGYLIQTIGTKKANSWGLYDMHGNVWEYCWDYFSEDYTLAANVDPLGAVSGPGRVIRGGSAMSGPSYCRSSVRLSSLSDSTWCGFRLVRKK